MPLPILCYHKVGDEATYGRWLNIHPKTLRDHIRFFARRGYTFLRAVDLAEDWPPRGVCLTFDDAYVSATTHGIEVLKSERVLATFYVVSDKVGCSSDWDPGKEARLANWDHLKEAAQDGYEIGNHTASHVRLGDLALDEQVAEIKQCREALSARGFSQASCCFPYGSHSPMTAKALEACGYRVGVALGKRLARENDPKFALPRIVMSYGDSLPMLLYKLHIRPRL